MNGLWWEPAFLDLMSPSANTGNTLAVASSGNKRALADPFTSDGPNKAQKIRNFDIFVRWASGKVTILKGLNKKSTMLEVATMFQDKEGVPFQQFWILHDGKLLFGKKPSGVPGSDYYWPKETLLQEAGKHTLEQLGVKNETTCNVILTLRSC